MKVFKINTTITLEDYDNLMRLQGALLHMFKGAKFGKLNVDEVYSVIQKITLEAEIITEDKS